MPERGDCLPSRLSWKRTQQHSSLAFRSGQLFAVSASQAELAIALKVHFGYNLGCSTSWVTSCLTG